MKNRELNHLMRNPKALMEFNATGRYPRARRTVSTPLRELLESIPRYDWPKYKGIKLSRAMGFRCSARFSSLCQLYTWLGGNNEVVGNKQMPYESLVIRSVKSVTIDTLIAHCSKVVGLNE